MRHTFWALLLLCAAAASSSGTESVSHAFMDDREHCLRCHRTVPGDGSSSQTPGFRKDIVALCLDCHGERDLVTLHPVDIRPVVEVPEDLPLDEYGTMTCVTCHDPHADALGDDGPYIAESLPRRIWALVSWKRTYRTYFLRRRNDEGQLCLSCHQKSLLSTEGFHVEEMSLLPEYVGSNGCSNCHPEIYSEWQRTSHARMTRDVRNQPDAIKGDFNDSPPFSREQVVYRLGVHWTERYVVEKDGAFFVKAPVWSRVSNSWDKSYWIDKPWTQYCQGCHTTGFEVRPEPNYVELGIGCESCHGPGRRHVDSGGEEPVVNPYELDTTRRQMVCESCHTLGHDRTGQYRFPLGYLPGQDLTVYYKGLLPKPGQDNESFSGDESYADRHRQWQFWVQHYMDERGVTCDLCKSFREREAQSEEKPVMTPSAHCLSCHREDWPQTELHSSHREQGVDCHRCHMPALSPDGKGYSIHDHKFMFLEPESPVWLSLRDSCGQCHKDTASVQGG